MTPDRTGGFLRARQRIGKYRIDRRLAEGGFATVYKAFDTVVGVDVALKVPPPGVVTSETIDAFRKEVRLTARLDHPNILPIKDAGFVDGVFIIATPLGEQSLGDRLQKRLSTQTIIDYAEQMLDAVAFAHRKGVMHCDIKPENFLIFPENRVRLADFGIARIARHTINASGTGTVGYVAPEQAMGKPSLRSDVFSLGLILYRMFSGRLPEWPYEWPPPGFDRVKRNLHPDLIDFLRRSIEVDDKKRFRDAIQMQAAFRRLKPRALRSVGADRRRRMEPPRTTGGWRTLRHKEFKRQYGKALETRHNCPKCLGPVSEVMRMCPWCGARRRVHRGDARFTQRCPRCRRGLKSDWRFCPWCYGAAVSESAGRRYADRRYAERCANANCSGKLLMPFMRYCPWCRKKVTRKWKIEGAHTRCRYCGWGVLPEYWDHCPWCARRVRKP